MAKRADTVGLSFVARIESKYTVAPFLEDDTRDPGAATTPD
jgi:hypothetical protein